MRSEAGSGPNMLEMFEVEASDEPLFGNLTWVQKNDERVDICVKAPVGVWRDMHEGPTIIRRETNPNGTIGQMPKEIGRA